MPKIISLLVCLLAPAAANTPAPTTAPTPAPTEPALSSQSDDGSSGGSESDDGACKWFLGDMGASCDEVCAANSRAGKCDAAALGMVDSGIEILNIAEAVNLDAGVYGKGINFVGDVKDTSTDSYEEQVPFFNPSTQCCDTSPCDTSFNMEYWCDATTPDLYFANTLRPANQGFLPPTCAAKDTTNNENRRLCACNGANNDNSACVAVMSSCGGGGSDDGGGSQGGGGSQDGNDDDDTVG